MVQPTSVLRAARNAFLTLIVVLMGVSVYQFAFVGNPSPLSAGLWTLGVVVYYLSKVYYDRQSNPEDTNTGPPDNSGTGPETESPGVSTRKSEDADSENKLKSDPLE